MSTLCRIAAGFALAAVAFGATGCGAVVARARIVGAETAIAAAKRSDADRKATYEYTGAMLYLEKAREEEAYSRFGAAIEFGGIAEQLAEKARLSAVSAEPETPPEP